MSGRNPNPCASSSTETTPPPRSALLAETANLRNPALPEAAPEEQAGPASSGVSEKRSEAAKPSLEVAAEECSFGRSHPLMEGEATAMAALAVVGIGVGE